MTPTPTSPETALPVRVLAQKIGGWIARLGEVWIDGQIAQFTRRPGAATQFLTLRDPDANISVTIKCSTGVITDAVYEGARVLVLAKPEYYIERGQLTLRAREIRAVGRGELLVRLEQLRRLLAAEGLFAADRKRPLPFLPRVIGLITGRGSAAERDVVENARRRLPGANFRIVNVATQGATAVNEVVAALEELDADPAVDVVVIARGGGSLEDLLPFSNESLVRAVSEARTPVVSAIGHESDVPLLDHVADLAASTPTDAGKRIVPDLREELARIDDARRRGRVAIRRAVSAEYQQSAGAPQRMRMIVRERIRREWIDAGTARTRMRSRVQSLLAAGSTDVDHLRARVRALSPQLTLERGYAVVQNETGDVVREPEQAVGELRVRVAGGEFTARRSG